MHVDPPSHLQPAGQKVWAEVTSKYGLRPDELGVLEDVCRTRDMIANLELAWALAGEPMTTTGSMGQEVIHPVIGELRAQRAAYNTLRSALKLPDLPANGAKPAPPPESTSDKARRAANARWHKGA